MNIVEENGGLRNTIAMESYDIGYEQLTDSQKEWIDQRVDQLGLCPRCGEKPTFRDVSGTFYDSSAHHWKVRGEDSQP